MTETSVLPDFPEVWDSSMRSAFVACPRQWFFGTLLSLRKSSTSIHLHFGGAIARGLEVTRKAFWQDGLTEVQSVAAGLHAVITAWGDWEPPEEILNSRASVKTLDAALDALYSYFENFPLSSDQLSPLIIDGEPMVEKTFALPVPDTKHPVTGQPIIYAGRFDMLASFNDAIFVVDEKTTMALGATWRSNWPLRGQLTGYCWGGRSFGLNVTGCVIRGIGVLKGSIQFEQAILTRPDWLVDNWLAQLAKDINRATDMWLEARDRFAAEPYKAFDQAFDQACSAYGGCGFTGLCESEHPENWYDSFQVVRWDPLRREVDA